jgi:hypothetical protein
MSNHIDIAGYVDPVTGRLTATETHDELSDFIDTLTPYQQAELKRILAGEES